MTHNPGEIIEQEGRMQWITAVSHFELGLDIVPVAKTADEQEIGIASFVVMEQAQPFLAAVGQTLAEGIAGSTGGGPLLLITAESKGSHLAPWVWRALADLAGNRASLDLSGHDDCDGVYVRQKGNQTEFACQ